MLNLLENSVHSSDSVEHAKEEIELWFQVYKNKEGLMPFYFYKLI